MKQWMLGILLVLFSQSIAFSSEVETQRSTLYAYKSQIIFQDEFISGTTTSGVIGSLGWGFSNGTVTQLVSETNRPGILRRDTGAGAGTVTSLRLNINASATFAANLAHDLLWMVRVNNNDADTAVRVGLATPAFTTDPPTDGIYFEKLYADTNWFCITRASSTETRTDSGIAVDTSFNTFAYEKISSPTSSVIFQINNTVVCTHTTNLPTGLSSPWTHIVNQVGAAKTLDHDYVQFHVYGLAR